MNKAHSIVKLLKLGKLPKEIKAELGVSGGYITFIKKRYGYALSLRGRTNLYEKEITEGLQSGLTPKQIREKNPNIANANIAGYRRKLGLPKFKTGRKKGTKNPNRKWGEIIIQEIRRMKQAGMSYRQIVKDLCDKVSYQAIQQTITDAPKPGIGVCPVCGQTRTLSRHHTAYINDIVQNICNSCHIKIHAKKACGNNPNMTILPQFN